MSIPFNGTRTRSAGLISAIVKQLKFLNLKPVKSINIQFDPFHQNAKEMRNLLFHITTPKITSTNPYCMIKPQIVSDLSEPVVKCKLLSGDSVVFKAANLTTLNILKLYNKHITPLAPAQTETEVEDNKPIKKKKSKKAAIKIPPGNKRRGVQL